MAAEVTEGTSDDTHLAADCKRQENAAVSSGYAPLFQEERRVASDGNSCTFQQFLDYYSKEWNTSKWNAAQDTRHIAANLPKSTSDDRHLADDSKPQENAHGEIPQLENFPISAYEETQEEVDDPWLPKSQTGARPQTVVVRLVEKFRIHYHLEWRTKLKEAIQGVLREVGHDQSVYVIDSLENDVHLTVQFGQTRRDILEVQAIKIRDWETIRPANFPLIGHIEKQQRTDMDLGEQSASRTNTEQNTETSETRT